jgi:hypothetical protein
MDTELVPKDRGRMERFGDWSVKVAAGAIKNPTATIAIGALVIFVAARVPTEIFYRRLDTTPEAVGLNSVEGLLQTITWVGVWALGVALIAGVLLFPLLLAYGWLSRIPKNVLEVLFSYSKTRDRLVGIFESVEVRKKPFRQELRLILRMGVTLVPLIAVMTIVTYLTLEAFRDSNLIRKAPDASVHLGPWTALRVEAFWTSGESPIHLPNCRHLLYLGESDGHVILFDANSESVLQLQSGLLQLRFPEPCLY